ncbi:MAG: hypothetical protein M1309_07165 [Actinobacteria bacterium]|nr:hypothetical protein [Actinomycetota bacterium]
MTVQAVNLAARGYKIRQGLLVIRIQLLRLTLEITDLLAGCIQAVPGRRRRGSYNEK